MMGWEKERSVDFKKGCREDERAERDHVASLSVDV